MCVTSIGCAGVGTAGVAAIAIRLFGRRHITRFVAAIGGFGKEQSVALCGLAGGFIGRERAFVGFTGVIGALITVIAVKVLCTASTAGTVTTIAIDAVIRCTLIFSLAGISIVPFGLANASRTEESGNTVRAVDA